MRQWRITAAADGTAPEPFCGYRVSRCSQVASAQPHRRRAIAERARARALACARRPTLAASDL